MAQPYTGQVLPLGTPTGGAKPYTGQVLPLEPAPMGPLKPLAPLDVPQPWMQGGEEGSFAAGAGHFEPSPTQPGSFISEAGRPIKDVPFAPAAKGEARNRSPIASFLLDMAKPMGALNPYSRGGQYGEAVLRNGASVAEFFTTGLAGMAAGGAAGAVGFGTALDQGASRKEAAKFGLEFGQEVGEGPSIGRFKVLKPLTSLVNYALGEAEDPTSFDEVMGLVTQAITGGADAAASKTGGLVSSEEMQLGIQAIMARLSVSGLRHMTGKWGPSKEEIATDEAASAKRHFDAGRAVGQWVSEKTGKTWDFKEPAPLEAQNAVKGALKAQMDKWAAAGEDASTPPKTNASPSFRKQNPTLAKKGFVDEFGRPMAVGAGLAAAIAATQGQDSDKAWLAAVPFAMAMHKLEPAVPDSVRAAYERAKLGDEGSILHLDRVRERMVEVGSPKADIAHLDDAIHALEEGHYGEHPTLIGLPFGYGDEGRERTRELFNEPPKLIVMNPDRNLAMGVLTLAAIAKMPDATPLKTLHEQLRYTTGALGMLAKEMGNRYTFTAEQLRSVLAREGVTAAEKEIFGKILEGKENITAKELVMGFKEATGDFELKAVESDEYADYGLDNIRSTGSGATGWEAVEGIPEDVRQSARTTIYQSPLDLGGANHFSDPNYFAHTRSFDEGGVRHVVEIQSDLAQKAGQTLSESEVAQLEKLRDELAAKRVEIHDQYQEESRALDEAMTRAQRLGQDARGPIWSSAIERRNAAVQRLEQESRAVRVRQDEVRTKLAAHARASAVDPVRPMLKDWWKRIVREEMGEAAQAHEPISDNLRRDLAELDPERLAELEARPRVVRFATADTVAKVEGWPDMRAHAAGQLESRELLLARKQSELAAKRASLSRAVEELGWRIRRQNESPSEATDRLADHARNNIENLRSWVKGLEEEEADLKEAVAKAKETLESLGADKRFSPEHQSIYDRYRREIERFLTKDLKGRPYTDPQGHTWIEVDLPKAERPISMFGRQAGKADPKMLGLLGLGIAAGIAAKQLDPEHRWIAALTAGAAAPVLARLAPRYAKYVASDFKAAMNDTLGVAGAALLVGTLQHDPVAAAIVGMGLMSWKALPRATKTPVIKTVTDLVYTFQFGIARRERAIAQFSEGIRKMVPDAARREAIFLAVDKGDLRGLSGIEQQAAKAWIGFSRDIGDAALKLGILKEFADNYVTYAVERAGGGKGLIERILAAREAIGGAEATAYSPYAIAHKFKYVEELERALKGTNLRLRTKDLAEVAEIYGRSMGRAIEGRRLINALGQVKESATGFGSLVRLDAKAPRDWVQINSPYLRGKRVHPEVAPHLKWFLEASRPNEIIGAAEALLMAQKRLSVSYSLFHAYNLGVAHIGASPKMGLQGVSDVARLLASRFGIGKGGPIMEALRQFYSGGMGDVIDKGLRGGLRFDPMEEVGIGAITKVGDIADSILGTRFAGKVGRGMEKVQAKFDKATWQYMHAGAKLLTFSREFEKGLADLRRQGPVTPEAEAQLARTVAAYTNTVYGHIDWYKAATAVESVLGQKVAMWAFGPQGRPFLQALLFAPDWTISTFTAMAKAFPSASRPIGSLEHSLHLKYALRTGMMLLTIHDAINYAMSGHHIWDREQKDPFRIQFRDGTQMQLFKHATEFFEWAREPWKTARNKMAYLPREVMAQFTDQKYPGGPPMVPAGKPTVADRASQATRNLAPYPVQPFFDPALTWEEAGKKSLLGMFGANLYGMTEDQKDRARAVSRELRAKERDRKKETAE